MTIISNTYPLDQLPSIITVEIIIKDTVIELTRTDFKVLHKEPLINNTQQLNKSLNTTLHHNHKTSNNITPHFTIRNQYLGDQGLLQ